MAINPYQPPTTIDESGDVESFSRIDDVRPVKFQGAPTRGDLNRLLANYDHVGFSTIMPTLFLCAMVVLFAWIAAPISGVLVVCGFTNIVLIACLVSTKAYRRAMYRFANPHWDGDVNGEMNAQGVWIRRDHGSEFLHWNCFESVIADKSVVGLITPNSLGNSLIITEEMTNGEADFAATVFAAKLASRQIATAGSIQQRKQTIVAIACDPARQRFADVPTDAIAFHGAISMNDLQKIDNGLPQKLTRRKRSAHGWIVQLLLLTSGLLIALGCVLSLTGDLAPVGAFLLVGVVLAGMIWWQKWSRPNQQPTGLLHYLQAFANEEGIMSDSFAIVTHLPWSHLKSIGDHDDRLILRHTHSQRVITARRDMFASESDWHAMQGLAQQAGYHETQIRADIAK